MRFIRVDFILMAAFMLSAAAPSAVLAATAADVERDYKWVDLSSCKKPPKPPQALPHESYRTYNVQRRYIDLDQDGSCEVMDFWIERLGDNASPGMRTLEQNSFKYKDGKWQGFSSDLKFYPYAVGSIKTKQVIYLEAPLASDVGDDMALGGEEIRLFVAAGWQASAPGSLDTFNLLLYQGRQGPVLQALAVFLTQRLGGTDGTAAKAKASTSKSRSLLAGERKRIRWLLNDAKQTLKPEEIVPVDADGMPILLPK